MTRNRPLILLLTLIALLLAACGGREISFSTANITSAELSKDEAGTRTTTTFAPEDIFYLIVKLANAPDSTKVKASWVAVSVPDVAPDTSLDDVELTTGSGTLNFDLANAGPWPAGSYKVDLYLNGTLERTLEFQVRSTLSSAAPTTAPNPTPVPEPATTGAVSGLDQVKSAVIQIEAQGTFRDPEVGNVYNVAGRGSGFIIDPSGIAVTNNHVVTGAGLLRVWVGGESQPRNARILGASECTDLAVIAVSGDSYPYLTWYDGPIDVGLDIYAAGFPLGDPEYTLTRGIIAKSRADGETSWASVDHVVQHDAATNSGNSGGPLVLSDGRVVAVHYSSAPGVNQRFAIAREQALPVLELLQAGKDHLSIGVNGQAVNNGAGLSGIWVSSVKSGSPADRAGVKAGDIITRLQGLVLATDGTMSDYCDVLRTHTSEDVLNIEVLRFDTEEVLEGQLNGRPLELSFSFARQVAQEATGETTAPPAAAAGYSDYTIVVDDSQTLELRVPTAWSQVDGSAWELEGEVIGRSLTVAPNISRMLNGWATPGVFFAVSDQVDIALDDLLDAFDYGSDCSYDGRTPYEDEVYIGRYDFWYGCGGSDGALLLVLAAQPGDGRYTALVLIQMIDDADFEAADEILATFYAE